MSLISSRLGGCVDDVNENNLKKKICYCKDGLCNAAVEFKRNQIHMYLAFIIFTIKFLL